MVRLGAPLLVARRDVGRVDHDAVHAQPRELIVNPESAVPRLLHAPVDGPGKVAPQIPDQRCRIRLHRKPPVVALPHQHAYSPGPQGNVQAGKYVLTREIRLCTFHGKPRGCVGPFCRITEHTHRTRGLRLNHTVYEPEPLEISRGSFVSTGYNCGCG